ncbi:protein translocase subunit SecD [Phragmitibacter flavus]|uniref:Multifunctional fusion protein n=1 Tax=Phragmitibacter flavus TaxID=2576071 RepID=A0A5R8KK49_9BACT|nr:protein translocase subunit SecD [Phragmitibacter flavus]TLD72672.1 protein translocase subunit SecD [Phragmitibacter flavus]
MHTPEITFLYGAVLLFLLFFYLGTAKHRSKKIAGTVLTLGISAFCLWAFFDIGIKRGIDLGGGSSFTVQLSPGVSDDGSQKIITSDSVQQAIGILEKRLNPDGAKDLQLVPQGTDRINIQMPGVGPEEVEAVRKQIEQVAHLEFRLVHRNSEGELASMKATGRPAIGYVEMPGTEHKTDPTAPASYLVSARPDLEGKYVKNAYAYPDPLQGWTIGLDFDSLGADLFAKLTSAHVGERLAIIVDGEVISAPNLKDAILTGSAVISGDYKEAQARGLATALENPLENPMSIIEESSVTAAFGEQTVKQGIYTGYISAVLIALFLVIYYRFAGLIALIGLAVCMLVVFGALALFNFTLTMPGIAGLVLTMGMAVDANVLIYERLREEIKNGKSIASALESSFEKAFSAIFDANFTTLISAVVLFYLASGLVKGFAVTLTIGIFGTMLGALIVTRVVFNWLIDANLLKKITVTQIIPDRIFNVMSLSRAFFIGTLLATVVVVGMFFVKGKEAIGIDFRGGALTRFEIKEGQRIEASSVEAILTEAGLKGFYVQESSTGTNELITVRSEYEDGTKVKSLVEAKHADQVSGGQIERVGSVVGKELAIRSLIAYAIAMIGMLIYLTIFYEWSFALAAMVALFHDCVLAIGVSVLFGQQLSVIHIGALLTVAGYSLNDTIIVFDRIREMLKTRSGSLRDLMNEAVSATLSRTLLTSVTVLMSMGVLYVYGGPSMRDFALPILIGVVVGTYSSIYIASALVLWYVRVTGKNLRNQILETEARREAIKNAASTGA